MQVLETLLWHILMFLLLLLFFLNAEGPFTSSLKLKLNTLSLCKQPSVCLMGTLLVFQHTRFHSSVCDTSHLSVTRQPTHAVNRFVCVCVCVWRDSVGSFRADSRLHVCAIIYVFSGCFLPRPGPLSPMMHFIVLMLWLCRSHPQSQSVFFTAKDSFSTWINKLLSLLYYGCSVSSLNLADN